MTNTSPSCSNINNLLHICLVTYKEFHDSCDSLCDAKRCEALRAAGRYIGWCRREGVGTGLQGPALLDLDTPSCTAHRGDTGVGPAQRNELRNPKENTLCQDRDKEAINEPPRKVCNVRTRTEKQSETPSIKYLVKGKTMKQS